MENIAEDELSEVGGEAINMNSNELNISNHQTTESQQSLEGTFETDSSLKDTDLKSFQPKTRVCYVSLVRIGSIFCGFLT